jgi:hypothetical protein
MSADGFTDVRITIATQQSSAREFAVARIVVVALAVASLASLPFRGHTFPVAPSFIPAFAGTTGMADLLAATLLFGLYRIDGTRAVLAAAIAYLFDTLLILPYALTFPGVVDPTGFFGNVQSAAWLWLTWHAAFPAVLLVGMALGAGEPQRNERRLRDVFASTVAVLVAAVAVAAVETVFHAVLPTVVVGARFTPLWDGLACVVFLANGAAAATLLLYKRPISTMRLWLVVALCASALDAGLNVVAPGRYTVAWYVGKTETFVTAAVVLLSLLGGWAATYAQSGAMLQRLRSASVERRSLQTTLERERAVSAALQQAALPQTFPQSDALEITAAYFSGNDEATIGGDWYDAFALRDRRIVATIGDVMGSGVRAAVTMTKLRQAMQAAAMLSGDPRVMLTVAEETLALHDPDGYATALALIYDPTTRVITFASAGHLPPLVRSADGTVREHRADGAMLGVPTVEPRDLATIDVASPCMVLLYTDGIIEQTRAPLDGQRRLAEEFAAEDFHAESEPAKAVVRRTLGDGRAPDDIAVLMLRFGQSSAVADGSSTTANSSRMSA